ncbi:restriction endonuclease subunit S [Yersinia enterocolitica]
MSAGKLPEGWKKIEIGDVAVVISGGTPKSGIAENFAPPGEGIAWLTPADLSGYRGKYISHGARDLTTLGYSSCSAKLMPKGTILFSSRAPIGYVAIAANEIATNQGFKSFAFTSDIFPDYAYYFLRNIRHVAEEMGTGTTFKEISGSSAKTLPFVLAPLAEQKIIAEKLDTLLAQVDSTKARLEQIPKILKRFRQAVLAAAVSGKLTESWRNEQGTNFSKWENTFFENICTEITVGYVGKMLDRYQSEGIPFLRSQNVREFKFSDKNLLYITESFHKEIFKSRLTPGDLAIVRSGAPGTTCVIPNSLPVANCSDLVIARPSEKLNSSFGCIFMNSNVAKINVSENRVGIAQQHFNVGSMKKMPIHLPPISEQTEIVRRVEQLFAYADTIEKQVNNALARVNNLTQSILAKAFRGELTAQWRAENPDLISGENSAAALLEKIKAERAAIGGKKASRKKT